MVPEKETVPPIALRTLRKLGEEARLHELIERGYEEAAFDRHGRTLSVEPICTCRPHHGAGGFISVSRLRLYEPDDRGAGERRLVRDADTVVDGRGDRDVGQVQIADERPSSFGPQRLLGRRLRERRRGPNCRL